MSPASGRGATIDFAAAPDEIQLFSARTPNGLKVPMALEELGLPYSLKMLDLDAGEQHQPQFLRINPNGRIPAMVVRHAGDSIAVFESGAILLHLADSHGRLLPRAPVARASALSWLFLQVAGLGPAFGQAGWFARNADAGQSQALQRFRAEAQRLAAVVEQRLSDNVWLSGDDYSVADIAHFCWLRSMTYAGLDPAAYPSIQRWCEAISHRPATRAALQRMQMER
jgi:GSH-dependent disulfide-bond oxidoreductase